MSSKIINSKLRKYLNKYDDVPEEFKILLKEFIARKQVVTNTSAEEFETFIDNFLNSIKNGIKYDNINEDAKFDIANKIILINQKYKDSIKNDHIFLLTSIFFHECCHAYDFMADSDGKILYSGIMPTTENGFLYNSFNEVINELKTEQILGLNPNKKDKNSNNKFNIGYNWLNGPLLMLMNASGLTYDDILEAVQRLGFNEFKQSLDKHFDGLGDLLLSKKIAILLNEFEKNASVFYMKKANKGVNENACRQNVETSMSHLFASCISIFNERIKHTFNTDDSFNIVEILDKLGKLHFDYSSLRETYINECQKYGIDRNVLESMTKFTSYSAKSTYDRAYSCFRNKNVYELLTNQNRNENEVSAILSFISTGQASELIDSYDIDFSRKNVLENESLSDEKIKEYRTRIMESDKKAFKKFDIYRLNAKLLGTVAEKSDSSVEALGINNILSALYRQAQEPAEKDDDDKKDSKTFDER